MTGKPSLDPWEYASDIVRGYCGIAFHHVANDTKILDPRPDGTVQLPQTPVTAVTSALGWMPGPTGVWDWQPLTYRWIPRGLLYNATAETGRLRVPEPSWPWVPGGLKIIYSHGFEVIPEDIQGVVTRLAAQISANPRWVQRRKVGDVETAYWQSAEPIRDSDKTILDRYAAQEVS
ncbi:hypothetical protein F5X71_34620 [Nocardia brasiliensis]|uniref:Uncharacterized protein n=1 Tax=Nocardia brasiliensis TaxID=37326 RepID=A0A6G9Y0P6_NOCBR|nr:hypothetical protein F5X71_34620 [Nocardia brasiliensis]